MTVKRAIEILSDFKVAEAGRGLFNITYGDGESEVVGEQAIIDLAREVDRDE